MPTEECTGIAPLNSEHRVEVKRPVDQEPSQHYEHLRRLAAGLIKRESRQITLDNTALVHEFYLRLRGEESLRWRGRAQFFALAAHLMRRILVDYARRRGRAKRGGRAKHLPLEEARDIGRSRPADLAALDDALSSLEARDPRKSKVVKLRYLAGLTLEEIARHLGVSTETVSREWSQAKAWLQAELSRGGRPGPPP